MPEVSRANSGITAGSRGGACMVFAENSTEILCGPARNFQAGRISFRGERFREALTNRSGGASEILIRMRRRDEPRLELSGRKENAPPAHRVKEAGVRGRVAPLDRREVGERAAGEEERRERADSPVA